MYIAGQIGWDSNGKVAEGIEAQTKLALENMGHVLEGAGCTHKNGIYKVKCIVISIYLNYGGFSILVVKVTVLLKNITDSPKMNEVYAKCKNT